MKWYHIIVFFLALNLPDMRKTQRVNLALLTAAIIQRRTLSISDLARASLPEFSDYHRHRKKRIYRFLSNFRFDALKTQCALIPIICELAGLKGLTPIMIDWSDLGKRRNGLFAAVCYYKRGLPLLCWATTDPELDAAKSQLEESFITRLLNHLPDRIRPMILADRGFGRASMIRFLQSMPTQRGRAIDYVVRLKKNVHIKTADGYQGLLKNYPLRKNRYVILLNVKYRSDCVATTNIVLYWDRCHKDPWYLATSLSNPRKAVINYRKRMQPEQYFRDGKQYFELDKGTVTTTERLGRMLTGLLLGCSLLLIVARRSKGSFRKQVCSWGKMGLLRMGIEYYDATPCHPPPKWLGLPHKFKSGYA